MEVDARNEEVVIHQDGKVELTVRRGKVITKKLSSTRLDGSWRL